MRGTRYLLLPAVIPGAFSALCTPLACSAVHVFLIRGTNEPYPGRQLPTAEGICEDWDCSWSNIEYPAVFNDYCDSVETGIANLGKAVTDYATRCPDAKIVLSGHSQGGQVVGDYLGGGGGNSTSSLGCVQQTSEGISPDTFPADHIGARAQSGWPRQGEQLESLNLWSNKLRDYCNLDDPACAGGSNWTSHENYFEMYKDDSAQFVRFKACQ
ncbi:acetylxylan esterase [Diaporthe helianthi]|uniref:Acetylxylan esterase n=1 Tax=Diaporthe helianthi TaxID=158607 RepID=A0A2P5IEZ7_DIAHE|nr:acetylxylan esterase [Diaporthe helianthi]